MARDKPIQAPKFQSDIDLLEKVRRENPEILQETRSRDPLLEDRLKQVRLLELKLTPLLFAII